LKVEKKEERGERKGKDQNSSIVIIEGGKAYVQMSKKVFSVDSTFKKRRRVERPEATTPPSRKKAT